MGVLLPAPGAPTFAISINLCGAARKWAPPGVLLYGMNHNAFRINRGSYLLSEIRNKNNNTQERAIRPIFLCFVLLQLLNLVFIHVQIQSTLN